MGLYFNRSDVVVVVGPEQLRLSHLVKAPVYNSSNLTPRLRDDDFPGVLVRLGECARVIVNLSGSSYAYQLRSEGDGGAVWKGSRYPTLAKLLANHGAAADGLADACAHLPDAPSPSVFSAAWAASDAGLGAAADAEHLRSLEDLEGVQPLNPYVRMGHDEWPGVLLRFGDDWRLVVNSTGKRYSLQQRINAGGGSAWDGPSYATLAKLLEKQSSAVEGLAQACSELPDRPARAMPDLTRAKAALTQVYEATDWRRHDYARVVRQDEQIRIAVCDRGQQYHFQWAIREDFQSGVCNSWKSLFVTADLSALSEFVSDDLFDTLPHAHRRETWRGRGLALLDGLPDNCSQGAWSGLSVRPAPVRAIK